MTSKVPLSLGLLILDYPGAKHLSEPGHLQRPAMHSVLEGSLCCSWVELCLMVQALLYIQSTCNQIL